MDHLHHFQLAEDPFRNESQERFLLETEPYLDAVKRVDRAVRQARGLVVVVGPVGSGKSHVVRRLFEELEDEMFEASMMVVLRAHADADWLLTRFVRQLGVEDPAEEREALIGQLHEQLAIVREDGRHAVLIVDDAHALVGGETLREVCGLLKLEYEERRLLTVVLAGAPELDAALAADPLLSQHVEAKVHLRSLQPDALARYFSERIERAGGDPKILGSETAACLHELSGGVPGLANTLADNALYEAFRAGRKQIQVQDVERAHTDLGWGFAPKSEAPASFGAPSAVDAVEPATPIAAFEMNEPEEIEVDEGESGEDVLFSDSDMDADSDLEADPLFATDSAESDEPSLMMESLTELPTEGPPKEESEDDEVDQLFMELLED